MAPYPVFSKKYEDDPNPKKDFAALMVCAQADAGCPIVFGSAFRVSLPFDDPKDFDGTEYERQKYDERVGDIGRQMLYVLSQLSSASR